MTKFRTPKEMKPAEERTPVSIRIRKSLKSSLTKEARAADLSLAELIENVLEDYQNFLKKK